MTANWTLWTCVSCLVLVMGCSKADPAEKPDKQAKEKTSKNQPTEEEAEPEQRVISEKDIDGIPLDVWYEDPLAISQQTTVVKNEKTPEMENPDPSEEPTNTENPVTPPSIDEFASLIPMESITDEVKRIRIRLGDQLSNVGKYNGNYKDGIRVDGAVLSALASIVIKHPESITWKPNGKYIRDLSAEMVKNANGLGAKPYDATNKVYQNIDQLLSGNSITELPESAESVPFSEVTSRWGLMKRMERGKDWLKSTITTEALMEKEGERIGHEAAVLASLSKIIMAEGYDSADDEEYLKYANELLSANKEIGEAVKAKNFMTFRDAVEKSHNACQACHNAGFQNN